MPALDTWLPGPEHPSPGHGEVHVWRIALSTVDAAEVAKAREILNERETARAERQHVEAARHRFILARAALRDILARYARGDSAANVKELARALVFLAGPHGKPRLADPAVSFNLSHAGEMALVAVARETEVGIDLEKIEARRSAEAITRRFFSPAEQAALSSIPGPERLAAFFRVWTRKEAVIKALGEGLACPLGSFDVSADPDDARLLALRRDDADAGRWNMLDLRVDPGYAAALAVAGPMRHVAGFDWRAVT